MKQKQQLNEELKQNVFSKIFQSLDSDGDDFINGEFIALETLTEEARQFLQPIFDNFDEYEEDDLGID